MRVARSATIALAIAAVMGFGGMSPAVAAESPVPVPETQEPTARPTEAPATEAPSTEAPTEAPATETPATEAPATETPATEAPSTETPPGDAPTAPKTGAEASTRFSAAAAGAIEPFPTGVQRLAGPDRYATAVAVSKRFEPDVPVLYIATGADFPDALSSAAAAAHRGGPLLLTQAAVLPDVVRAEIVRLAPRRIVVAGGETVVGAAVFRQLASLTPSIVRISGRDRYETGERLVADAFGSATQAFIATGRTFPDALAASAAAGAIGAPVLLVDGSAASLRTSTISTLKTLRAGTVRIAGGTGAVGAAIAKQLASNGFGTTRHSGLDRYLTAAAINEAVFGVDPALGRDAFLATGADFADALAGAALAGAAGDPLYLTTPTCIPHPVWVALNQLSPPTRVIVGGTGVVGDEVAANTPCPIVWAKPASGRITDVFGPRDPICTAGGCTQSLHRGVDLGTGCNAPIHAASGGRVSTAGWVGTYGNFVKIAHGKGIDTGYAHLADGGVLVKVGQLVRAGQQIGWSGATGAATGCHLHFEVYQSGTQIDPVPFMRQRGITLG